jgi:hypothetical protein
MGNTNNPAAAFRPSVLTVMTILVSAAPLLSASAAETSSFPACSAIEKACLAAGFVNGEHGKGYGLWDDCVDPIFQGKKSEPGATKRLPEVAASVVAACEKEDPQFLSNKGISKPAALAITATTTPIPVRAALTQKDLLFPDLNINRLVSNWNALATASHGIVGLKAWESGTDGQITKENVANFEENLRQAEARKMIVIGYAFGVGGISGTTQANALLALFHMGTPGHPAPGHILALDLETNPYGPSMTTAEANAFVERVKVVTGRYPILYAGEDIPRPGALGKCPRWVASYGSDSHAGADIWQYTDGVLGPEPRSFPGVGSCDINKLLVTYGTLRKMVGL